MVKFDGYRVKSLGSSEYMNTSIESKVQGVRCKIFDFECRV
jgi:hypothetical protein